MQSETQIFFLASVFTVNLNITLRLVVRAYNQSKLLVIGKAKKKNVCLRSPDRSYFSATDPNLFYRQLFYPNFC